MRAHRSPTAVSASSTRSASAIPARASTPACSRSCKLRHRGEGTKIDAIHGDPRYPYLRVYAREGNVARSFPVGLVEGDVSEELVEGFCGTVFDRYRALDPNLRCMIVYSGELASEDLVRVAGARNVELRSFVELQGIIDFRRYVERQTSRLESDPIYPPGLYVPQSLVYDVGRERRTSRDALGELMGWLSVPRARFVLVLGDFGTGKTFLLHELARRMPERLPHLVPVLVELRALEKARTLDQLIAQHLATADERYIDLDAFRYMLREGRIVLLFDGFDELAARVTYRRATEHFETLLQAAGGDAKILVTSRTQHFESDRQVRSALLERAATLPGLSVCRIEPFDDGQIVAFLEHLLGDERKAHERFKLIDEIKDLLGLSHNPRMLGFIAAIPERQLREARDRTGTITATELYRLLIDQWFDYELDKLQSPDVAPDLLREQLWEAVTALALRLWTETDRTVGVSELAEHISTTVQRLSAEPRAGSSLDPDTVTHLVGSRTLLVRDGEGAFAFVHASVMEWFVAHRVGSQIADGVEPEVLGAREMTKLMTDFVCDLAGRERALAWAQLALAEGDSSASANALLVLDRLGEHAGEAALSEENLGGRDLSKRDLVRAKFVGTDLTEASLASADLSHADLTESRLVRADLTRAVLAGATLDGADARGARLLGADLRGASLGHVNLRRAKLLGALVDADALEGCDTFGAALPGVGVPEPMLAAKGSPVTAVAMHPTGEFLACAGDDGTVRLWDPQTGAELRTLTGHQSGVLGVAFSADGGVLASAGDDGTVRLWDPQTGAELRTLTGHQSGVLGVAFSAGGGVLASASDDGTVRLWDPQTGAELRTLTGHQSGVLGVAFSADGGVLASASEDGTVRLWDPQTGAELRTLSGHQDWVLGVAFSADGGVLASASEDGTVRLWDPRTGAELRILSGHQDWVRGVAFSADGGVLASAGDDGTVRLWDPRTGAELRILSGHQNWVLGVAFSADGGVLASAGDDGTVRLWDSQTGAELRILSGHRSGVLGVAFSADGGVLASASEYGTVRLWDSQTGAELRTLSGHQNWVQGVAFSADGGVLASAGDDGTVRLWDSQTGTELHTLTGHQSGVQGVAFSADGRVIASAGNDSTVRLWDPQTGAKLRTLSGHQDWVRGVAFSADGRVLASASDDGTVRLWDPRTGAELRTLTGHQKWVRGVAFSADGRVLASAGNDGTVRLWDPQTGTELHTLTGHQNWVQGVAFSADGRVIASAGDDRTVRLWDPQTGAKLHTLTGHQSGVQGVAFSADGRVLASAGNDGTVRLWDPATGALRATLVNLQEGLAVFTPDGRYRVDGRIGGAFWYAVGLCRFAPGEFDDFVAPGTLRRLEAGELL